MKWKIEWLRGFETKFINLNFRTNLKIRLQFQERIGNIPELNCGASARTFTVRNGTGNVISDGFFQLFLGSEKSSKKISWNSTADEVKASRK